jgi:hypothetical protein
MNPDTMTKEELIFLVKYVLYMENEGMSFDEWDMNYNLDRFRKKENDALELYKKEFK